MMVFIISGDEDCNYRYGVFEADFFIIMGSLRQASSLSDVVMPQWWWLGAQNFWI
jgi:hypothetical protein